MKNITNLDKNKKASLNKAQLEVASFVLGQFASGYPADRSLSSALRAKKYLGSRDRRFISENVFSLFRWWGWIREIADANCEIRSLADNPGLLSNCLDLAAVISEIGGKGACIPPAQELSGRFQVPARILSPGKLLPDYFMACLSPGFVAENMITACQSRPPIWIRTRRGCRRRLESALKKNDAVFESPGQVPDAMKVVKCGTSLYSLPEFEEGLFEVQDIASQAVALISAPKPGEKWLDACAGAGGKTLHLADLMEGRGSIVSQDSDKRKIAELMRRAARGGFSNIRPKTADSSKKDKRRVDFFDGVLVDAPCSCSGTWRRNPDGRWRTKEGEIRRFHNLQLAILNASATSVRKGGSLVYATCSVFKAENDDVVAGFLSANPGFKPANFASPFDGKNILGTFHVDPLSLDSDAMFIAKFRRDV